MESGRGKGKLQHPLSRSGKGGEVPTILLFSVLLLELNSDQAGESGDKLDEFSSCGVEMLGS